MAIATAVASSGSTAHAQASRLAILQAEERGAPTAADLATIRAGARSSDGDTVRVAIRALGRLERPALVSDIVPALRFRLPEVRAEAANAIGSAFAGLAPRFGGTSPPGSGLAPPQTPPVRLALASAMNTLIARLSVEDDPNVRAVIRETIGRLPYTESDQVRQAEQALVGKATESEAVPDRLGLAKGLEALMRTNGTSVPPSAAAVDALKTLVGGTENPGASDPLRDARVRRLALEALIAANAIDEEIIEKAAVDPDPQVRRLAMRATWRASGDLEAPFVDEVLRKGLADPISMVRIETLQGPTGAMMCGFALRTTDDPDVHVALVALDQLAGCKALPEAAALLERTVDDLFYVSAPRGWDRQAHALVSLAGVAPDRASMKLGQFAGSSNWALRLYAARAAGILNDRATVEQLAADSHRSVSDEAGRSLAGLKGLRPTVSPGAPAPPVSKKIPSALNAADLRRLAAPRALVTIRGVGSFELALFTSEAPATVLRFVRLAESGYYNGSTVDRILPNSIIELRDGRRDPQGDATFAGDEIGVWPHVRGAFGLSDDSSGALIIDLVDNPRFDHERTVFAQILNGLNVIDDLLEGDVIDRIDIIP